MGDLQGGVEPVVHASPMKKSPGPLVAGRRAPAAAWARVEKVLVWPEHWACSTSATGRVGAAPCSSNDWDSA